MISRARPSTRMRRPIADGSPPNRVRQYPLASITVSAPFGESSSLENTRPSAGPAPRIGSRPSVAMSERTSSGSPMPVTLSVPVVYIATS